MNSRFVLRLRLAWEYREVTFGRAMQAAWQRLAAASAARAAWWKAFVARRLS